MRYDTNCKHSYCLQISNLELRTNNEVQENIECTNVMLSEQNYQSKNNSLGRFLGSKLVAVPLVMLSFLKGVDGFDVNAENFRRCLISSPMYMCQWLTEINIEDVRKCSLSSTMCRFINLMKHLVADESGTVKVTLDKEGKKVSLMINTHSIKPNKWTVYFDIGRYYKMDVSYFPPLSGIINTINQQLHSVYIYINRRPEEFQVDKSSEEYYKCRYEFDSVCDINYRENSTITDLCCPDIRSYIEEVAYPSKPLTTIATEIISSTADNLATTLSDITGSKTISTTEASEATISIATSSLSEIIRSTAESLATTLSEITVSKIISTTESSETTSSTATSSLSEIINSTAIESINLIPTEIGTSNKGDTTLTVILVALLSIALAILVFLGYISYKSRKTHRHQVVPSTSNNDVEIEDLV
ncbi:putative membrane protein [Candidatus Ichthyocystis hellenicum]|uniref:Putative membrane protein n=1 Tax=Candidatus Ichthyocystis hellenicum TaxID=1561003 RepID=A0A0S4M881_9BURK|nr:hypothetical protein [Candidatus Ichthyocystis hellenicum]CUT18360.1 putative membrane protein [Candidatus Ichthyocystis hellenicum]